MAMEPGGRADKLGNEYERLWVVYRLLRVLTGEDTAVTWEPAGHDAEGIDVLVELPSGFRSLQSCKRENVGHGKWTMAHLNGRAVLQAAKTHLAADTNNRFVLVSRDPCPDLRDLAERAGRYDGRADVYYDELPAGLRHVFHQLGAYWDLKPESSTNDRAIEFRMLTACEALAYDLNLLREHVRTHAQHTIEGDPDITRTLLADFAVQHLGTRLDQSQIIEFLKTKGLTQRLVVDTDTSVSVINKLQTRFIDSIRPYLIGGQLLPRTEATSLVNEAMSEDPTRARLIMVHGRAGIGKSGVLFELVETLKRRDIPFLPIRLDRYVPTGCADHFGREICGLPSSPTHALSTVAGQNRSVLILDQLDALRWTAAHTDEPMGVLTEIVREALNPLSDSDVTVVVVCRTFDLEDDPRIAHLKSLAKSLPIEIGLLDLEATRNIVNTHYDIWTSLTDSQRSLLQQPQALFVWTQLNASGNDAPVFRTYTDLMRAFWSDLFQDIRPHNINVTDLQHVLDQLVERMDNTGRLMAPSSLIGAPQANILDFLQSSGIIRIDDHNQCVFTHQSYFDFLVAEQLNRHLLTGKTSLSEWLISSDQSLFRRDQLRQVLALQRDDDTDAYVKAIESVLSDDRIRFHLKHLIIRLLSQAEPPISGEVDLIIRLVDDPEWREQAYGQILWNKPPWFKILDEKHLWTTWLDSGDESLINMALRMLGLMTRHFGDRAADIFGEYVSRGAPWPDRIAQGLSLGNLEEESDAVFDLRVSLARQSQRTFGHVWWERLAKNHPKRAIRLFDLRTRLFIRAGQALRLGQKTMLAPTNIESDGRDDTKWLCKAAARCPLLVWERLAPMCLDIERLRHWAQHKCDHTDFRGPIYELYDQSRDLLKQCEDLLVAGGRSLARRNPDSFKRLITEWDSRPRTSLIERSLVRSIEALPDTEADYAIDWLIAKPRRLRIGDSFDFASKQEPARRVIARRSEYCSDSQLSRLENAILNYRDPDLKRMLQYEHDNYAMKGFYSPNHHGKAQYILLSALPAERMSDSAEGQLGVWHRKFGKPPSGRGPQVTSGWVGSTIPQDRLQFISDTQWLYLVSGSWSKRPTSRFSRKVMGTGQLGEASHDHFAKDMGTMTRRQPVRFAKLALVIPDEAPPNYMRQIMLAFDQKDPPEALVKAEEQNNEHPDRIPKLKRELALWRVASCEEIEAVIAKVGFPSDRETAKAICWLVDKRDDIKWSKSTIDLIAKMASEHPCPAPDHFASGRYDEDDRKTVIPDVANSSLNCVRGTAALAIKSIVFSDYSQYEILKDPIVALTHDDNVSVRAAATAICVPILNIDKNQAVDHFLAICDIDDDRVFLGHYLDWFLQYALWSHHEQLIPTIERMAKSEIDEVSKRGAAWATAAKIYEGWCDELLATCRTGSQPQRHGVAETAGQSPWKTKSAEVLINLLEPLFNDEDKDVRHSASRVFWKDGPWQDARVINLAFVFIESQAFVDDPTPIIRGLGDAKGSILKYDTVIHAIADKFAGSLANAAKDMSRGMATDVPNLFKLILRLYQQAQDNRERDIQVACLDCWDALLRAGVGVYRDAEQLLDATEY